MQIPFALQKARCYCSRDCGSMTEWLKEQIARRYSNLTGSHQQKHVKGFSLAFTFSNTSPCPGRH